MTGPTRILYVDDEPDLLEISRLFLEESGDFSVTTTDSGSAALNLLKEQQFDAIVSDYQMPGMDGIQLLVEVRSHFGQVPFILFTGKGREEVVIQAINSGADFYIQKGGEPGAQFAELGHKIKQASSRQQALDSLRKSEERYRHLIEHANEAIVVAQDGLLKMVNPRGVELIGYPEQEILSMAFSLVIHPDDRAMVGERYQKRLKGEELPSRYAFRLNPKDGRTLWVEISAVVIDWDGRPATLNFLTDITERKLAEEALQESESFNRNLIENLPDYIGVSGPDGKVLYMNQSAVNALGYTVDETIGTPMISYVAEEYRDEVISKMADRHGGGEVPPYEIVVLSRDGHRISVIVKGATIQYRDTPAYLLVLTDITGRKEAEAAVRVSRDRLSTSETDLLTHKVELEAQAEELKAAHLALGESRDKYLDLYEFAPLGYLMLTDKALVAEANLTAATLLGVERSRLIDQRFSKFVDPADSDQWHQYFMHILDQVEKLSCNLTLTRGDGVTFPARLEGIRITSGSGVTTVRVAVSDISDIRRADEFLKVK